MRTLGLASLVASLVLPAACYSPDLSGVKYTCSAANPYCPDGLSCIAGICAQPGAGPMPMGDGGTSSGSGDGAVMSGGDMGAPTMNGCKSGTGPWLGGNVFACAGQFNPYGLNRQPNASGLCATGFVPCTMGMINGANLGQCKSLSGFFAAAEVASLAPNDMNAADISCAAPQNGAFGRLLLGCGRSASSIYALNSPCSGFSQALDCRNTSGWNCNFANSLDNSSNSNDSDGVLCCKM